jgi:hypothetical protein
MQPSQKLGLAVAQCHVLMAELQLWGQKEAWTLLAQEVVPIVGFLILAWHGHHLGHSDFSVQCDVFHTEMVFMSAILRASMLPPLSFVLATMS